MVILASEKVGKREIEKILPERREVLKETPPPPQLGTNSGVGVGWGGLGVERIKDKGNKCRKEGSGLFTVLWRQTFGKGPLR